MTLRGKSFRQSSVAGQRHQLRRQLNVQLLETRQLLAVNVLDDTFNLSRGAALNVLTNDSTSDFAQSVSAANFDYDPATVNKASNLADWFIPNRPGTDPAVPQRSMIANALVEEPAQSNFGDMDLWIDDGAGNQVEMFRTAGIALGTIRENTIPSNGSASTNLSIISYVTEGTGNVWFATQAAPQNDGEGQARIAGALFRYADGWVGASINSAGGFNYVPDPGNPGLTVTKVGTGRYEIAVDGVTDSFSEGFLFAISAQNSDNYSHTMPMGGNKWLLMHRDNAAALTAGEDGAFNVLYIPRTSQGLIGGHVNARASEANPLYQSFGDFSIQKQASGFWRMSVPGHSPTSGVLVLETNDASTGLPDNVYLSYEADGNDFIIRSLTGNTMLPANSDFNVFFIPFENTLAPTSPLTVSALTDTTGSANPNVSDKGIALSLNADGTVNYAVGNAIASLGAGQVDTDSFIYTATDGVDSQSATVVVNWVGANDAPNLLSTPSDIVLDEDDAPIIIDLTTVFADVDSGDVLTYSTNSGLGGLVGLDVTGSTLTVTPNLDKFGFTRITLTATDAAGASVSVVVPVTIFPQDDNVVAVGDSATTDKETAVNVPVLVNDYHPDNSPFSVASALINSNPAATNDAGSAWTVTAGTTAPNQLTIQSAPNLGDVAVGRNGVNLFQADGVFLGTVRDNTTPYQTVNTYAAFSSYGFATDRGIGGGERNSPLHAAFFPFAEGWISGHVSAEGVLQGGVGISQANITKLGTGWYEITIPGVSVAEQDGLLFAINGANDDNIDSVWPSSFDNKWQIRLMDSDSAVDGFEDDPWSFVFIPGSAPDLLAGRFGGFEEERGLKQSYGGVSATEDFATGNIIVSVPGYTPADGALIALSSGSVNTTVNGNPVTVPRNNQVFAVPSSDGLNFVLETRNSLDYSSAVAAEVQFIFLPFDAPLERLAGLDFSITSFDALSAFGATVTLESDGTFTYDPSAAGAPIDSLGNGQVLQDTFTYTISDGRGGVSTATVTITVQGENSVPVAGDDTIELSEAVAQGALLSVLNNDSDADLQTLFGTPVGVAGANLSVGNGSVWSVAGTGTGANQITLGAGTTGDVEVTLAGAAIAPTSGVVMATIRQNVDTPASNFRLVQSYANGTGGTSLALRQFGGDAAADAQVAVSYFRFADNWIGGHVNGSGALVSGNGVAASDIVRTGVGRYAITVPGVTDAATDGFLLVIGNQNADNTATSRAVTGTGVFEVAVRDNQQDFGAGEDGGFSFVFIPRNAQNLVAGTINSALAGPNPVTLGVGQFTIERMPVTSGGTEWKLTIPGQTPDTGMLVLTNQDNTEIEDNYLTYASDGAGSFLIRNHDMPGMGRQEQPFSFVFVPFDAASGPVYRPVVGPLGVQSVDATSSLGATLTIQPNGTIAYNPGTLFESLYFGDSAVDTFSYTVSDGFGGSDTATVTVNIAGFGDAPALSASVGTTFYGVGDSAIGVDRLLNIQPIGTAFLDGAVFTATISNGAIASDLLSIRNEGTAAGQIGVTGSDVTFGGTVIGSFTGGASDTPLTITLNSAATVDAVRLLLRAIRYSNSNSDIVTGTRTVSFGLVDGNGRVGAGASKNLSLRVLRSRDLQQGVDYGYGIYSGAADAQIRENEPNTVIAPEADFLIDFDATGVASQALLKFGSLFGDGPGQIPLGSVITSAELIVETNPNTANASGDGGTFHRMLQDWDPSTATWNSLGGGLTTDDVQARAAFDSQIGLVDGSGSTGTGFLSFSVLPDVRAWAAGEANYGWAIKGWELRTDGWFFSSSEDETPTARPRLKIEWLPAGANSVSFQQGEAGYVGTVDTDIRPGAADLDRSTVVNLAVDDPGQMVLMRFDDIIGEAVGQVPAGAIIHSARLTLASTQGDAMGDGGRFFAMLTSWNATDTWNTLVDGVSPDGVEAASAFNTQAGVPALNPNVQGGFNSFDVTVDVQNWVSGTVANNGWAIIPWVGGTDGWGIQSSESTTPSYRPKLEIFYSESENSAPTDIQLSNSNVAENTSTAGGLLVGTLSTIDPNPGDTHTYELFAGVGVNDNALFTISGDQLLINDGVVLDHEVRPSYVVRVRSTDGGGLTFDRELTVSVTNRGEVQLIAIGSGAQRSRVQQVSVTFDQEVTINAGAFEVTKRGASGGAVPFALSTAVVSGKTVATLSFVSGDFISGGSLVDGNYQLRIVSANILDQLGNALDGDKDGSVGGDRLFGNTATDAFFRLYGDTDGNRSVTLAEFNQFRSTFGRAEGDSLYRDEFDFDDNGSIALADFNQFRSRFGSTLSFE